MSDPIDRQAAIDALHTWFRDGFEEDKWWNSTHVLAALEGVPSAQHWIPCSERLPENSGWHIVTKELDYDTTFVGLEWYDSTNGWKYDNSKCIAWIPLPESYKGEQE